MKRPKALLLKKNPFTNTIFFIKICLNEQLFLVINNYFTLKSFIICNFILISPNSSLETTVRFRAYHRKDRCFKKATPQNDAVFHGEKKA
jgi:hypothetical protein